MTPVKIKHRETVNYAMQQPDILRVEIATGNIIVDRRETWAGGDRK